MGVAGVRRGPAELGGRANVTATPLDWNRDIVPNASVSMGFNGTHGGQNPAPAVFTINGIRCDPA